MSRFRGYVLATDTLRAGVADLSASGRSVLDTACPKAMLERYVHNQQVRRRGKLRIKPPAATPALFPVSNRETV